MKFLVRYDKGGTVKEEIMEIPASKNWSSHRILRVASEQLLNTIGSHTLLRVKSVMSTKSVSQDL